MLNELKQRDFARLRRDAAPLREEREQYLAHLLNQGTNPKYVRALASRLILVSRFLEMSSLRPISDEELDQATEKYLHHIANHQTRGVRPTTAQTFRYAAEKWLRFHKLWSEPKINIGPFSEALQSFSEFIVSRQLSIDGINSHKARLSVFLTWAGKRWTSLSGMSLIDVDAFLAEKRREGLKPASIASYCHSIRTFFHYSAQRGWTPSVIARGIKSSPISRVSDSPRGPSWKDVRRILAAARIGNTAAELRASAILSLCAMYGLRGAEIRRLSIDDFDWIGETFIVRRAKGGRIQQFPILYEVGEAVLRYLRYGRPICRAREVFVTMKPPYRPMNQCVLTALVRTRIRVLDIDSDRHGTHGLRHACATELLRRRSSLIEIADFLGHRSIQSVSRYAKLDTRSLRQVTNFSLAGAQ